MISKVVFSYLAWITLHYVASHFYVRLCTPLSLFGFLSSPFISLSPHCSALRWVVFTGSDYINFMWLAIGGWSAKYLTTYL